MFWNDEKTSIRWNTQEYMETKLIHLVMCEVHYMKCSRVLGALMGHMKDRHAWHRSAVRYREHEKFWREGPKDLTCYEKKMNEGITEHSTRCFQCPPQGVAPCGALLPFEGTLNIAEDQKIQNSCKWKYVKIIVNYIQLFMNTEITVLNTHHKAFRLAGLFYYYYEGVLKWNELPLSTINTKIQWKY